MINIKFDKNPNDKHDGWYERYENNGWRPVINPLFIYFYRLVIRSWHHTMQ